MSDIYFIQVKGADPYDMNQIADRADNQIETDDNIVFVTDTISPMSREEAKAYLEDMADSLDMEVSDESG